MSEGDDDFLDWLESDVTAEASAAAGRKPASLDEEIDFDALLGEPIDGVESSAGGGGGVADVSLGDVSLGAGGSEGLTGENDTGVADRLADAARAVDLEEKAAAEADAGAGEEAGEGVVARAGEEAGAGVVAGAGEEAGAGVDAGAGAEAKTGFEREVGASADPRADADTGAVSAAPARDESAPARAEEHGPAGDEEAARPPAGDEAADDAPHRPAAPAPRCTVAPALDGAAARLARVEIALHAAPLRCGLRALAEKPSLSAACEALDSVAEAVGLSPAVAASAPRTARLAAALVEAAGGGLEEGTALVIAALWTLPPTRAGADAGAATALGWRPLLQFVAPAASVALDRADADWASRLATDAAADAFGETGTDADASSDADARPGTAPAQLSARACALARAQAAAATMPTVLHSRPAVLRAALRAAAAAAVAAAAALPAPAGGGGRGGARGALLLSGAAVAALPSLALLVAHGSADDCLPAADEPDSGLIARLSHPDAWRAAAHPGLVCGVPPEALAATARPALAAWGRVVPADGAPALREPVGGAPAVALAPRPASAGDTAAEAAWVWSVLARAEWRTAAYCATQAAAAAEAAEAAEAVAEAEPQSAVAEAEAEAEVAEALSPEAAETPGARDAAATPSPPSGAAPPCVPVRGGAWAGASDLLPPTRWGCRVAPTSTGVAPRGSRVGRCALAVASGAVTEAELLGSEAGEATSATAAAVAAAATSEAWAALAFVLAEAAERLAPGPSSGRDAGAADADADAVVEVRPPPPLPQGVLMGVDAGRGRAGAGRGWPFAVGVGADAVADAEARAAGLASLAALAGAAELALCGDVAVGATGAGVCGEGVAALALSLARTGVPGVSAVLGGRGAVVRAAEALTRTAASDWDGAQAGGGGGGGGGSGTASAPTAGASAAAAAAASAAAAAAARTAARAGGAWRGFVSAVRRPRGASAGAEASEGADAGEAAGAAVDALAEEEGAGLVPGTEVDLRPWLQRTATGARMAVFRSDCSVGADGGEAPARAAWYVGVAAYNVVGLAAGDGVAGQGCARVEWRTPLSRVERLTVRRGEREEVTLRVVGGDVRTARLPKVDLFIKTLRRRMRDLQHTSESAVGAGAQG